MRYHERHDDAGGGVGQRGPSVGRPVAAAARRRSGVPQSTIARIESGKQMPRADTLDKLLEACGWELDMTLRRGARRGPEPDPALALPVPGRNGPSGAAHDRYADEPWQRGRAAPAGIVTASSFDPIEMLRVLSRAEVEFVVIGGFAAELLGAPLDTNDLDICYERSAENMDRLATALRQLGAKLRVAEVDEDLPFLLDGRTLAAGDSFTFVTDAGEPRRPRARRPAPSGFRDLTPAPRSATSGRRPLRPGRRARRPHAHEAGERPHQGRGCTSRSSPRCEEMLEQTFAGMIGPT